MRRIYREAGLYIVTWILLVIAGPVKNADMLSLPVRGLLALGLVGILLAINIITDLFKWMGGEEYEPEPGGTP